jgi:hypothetical protein
MGRGKGIEYLLSAWTQIIAAIPEGEPAPLRARPDETRLRSLALCLGIDDSVHFAGICRPYSSEIYAKHYDPDTALTAILERLSLGVGCASLRNTSRSCVRNRPHLSKILFLRASRA